MGEAKDKEAALKAAREEEAKRQEEFKKLLETPLTKEEYGKEVAALDVEKAKLYAMRQKLISKQDGLRAGLSEVQIQLDAIDESVSEINLSQTILLRRSLNTVVAAAGKIE